jgi:dTDP-4-amino-4,6-dideoxy-D-galactose acyltransferase
MTEIELLLKDRANELRYYSPDCFFKTFSENSFNYFVKDNIELMHGDPSRHQLILVDRFEVHFYYEYLEWDSVFFGIETLKLQYVLYPKGQYDLLVKAVVQFTRSVVRNKYVFFEAPSEDIILIQAINEAGFRLVETRMTYYLDLTRHNYQRFKVREAEENDINNLKHVAEVMVNPFDRFHADIHIGDEMADKFLGTFIEQSVKGFADYVILPNESNLPSDSFVTARYQKEFWPHIATK